MENTEDEIIREEQREEKNTCVFARISTSEQEVLRRDFIFLSFLNDISVLLCNCFLLITSTSLLSHLSLDCLLYCVCDMIMSASCRMNN